MTTPDIFLSYNREDAAVASRYADAFAAEGLNVWWDTALRSGEAYDEVTEAALRGAKAVVVLWSPRSVVSRWVRAEATIADRCKTLVPVMIEACERPIMFELTQTAELSHWTGDASDKAWLAFLGDVRRFVAEEAVPAALPVTAQPAPVEATLKPGQSGSAPSLAILPFTNRSSLADDDVFAEGLVEDVISALSQGVNVRVLGSMSTAHLRRGATIDLAAIGRQLGVRYLLEGNVRRIAHNLRVTTQLLEATSGEIVWTGKFDRPLEELADLQEELVTEIARNLDAQVYTLEMEKALKKPSDLTAWEAVTRGSAAYRQVDELAMQRALDEALRAAAIAPDYGPAHAAIANAYSVHYFLASDDDPDEVRRIRGIAERAIALAPDDASVLSAVGSSLGYLGFPEEAVRYSQRAVRKAPGSGSIHYNHGFVCRILGRHEDALFHLNVAAQLIASWHLMWAVTAWRSQSYSELGRWAEAEAAADESIALNPGFGQSHICKALACLHLGREAEALGHIAAARRVGLDRAPAERYFRRVGMNSPRLEADIAAIRALYAQTEEEA